MLKYSTYKSIHNQPEQQEQSAASIKTDIQHTSADTAQPSQTAPISATKAEKGMTVDTWTYASELPDDTNQKRKAVSRQKPVKKTLRQKTLNLIEMTVQKSKWKSSGRLLICVLFASILLYGGFQHLVIADEVPGNEQRVIVESGDSLWAIASRYKSEETDIRDYVAEIRDHNQLVSTQIKSGDVLVIPYD
ncbi:LysM peptidoglycan-binding domain-containing protein [Paenibacillus wulumuqiensis]|uniref:LysM peptidoglycan-binding domain-containing protein n=1 Tax=Paenibacillus wulumuqiensis TaxID=1567107 RepID=UPI000698FF56|nr:LysM peptidoglycan-binding domain-containing protein [Paenibacillus wulumuqiensis]